MKIQKKLIIAFGFLILVLLAEIVINQVITYRAKNTFIELKENSGPTLKLLDEYKMLNRELGLLNNTWVANYDKRAVNKINALVDVELPHFKSKISTINKTLTASDSKSKLFEDIIDQSEKLIVLNKELINILVTKQDYEDKAKLKEARIMISQQTAPIHFMIDDGINRLQSRYNHQYESSQNELLNNLKSASTIIFILGIIGIVVGFIVARQVVNSILDSIYKLSDLAQKVSAGKFGMQTKLKGNDELALLGDSLNIMSHRLEEIFNKNEDKIKELQEFAYIATHDLKVPVDNIKGLHIALMKGLDIEDERTKQIKEYLEISTDQASRIIADLVKVTQEGDLEDDEEELRLENVFKDVHNNLRMKIKAVDGEVSTAFEYPTVKFSRRVLISIFQNLISNAVKYHSPKRKLKIDITAKIEGDYLCLAFTDNGLGINLKTQREKLFGLFKRIYTQNEGSGIGLYMIKRSIEKYGGKIDVKSEVDVGSTFYVYLKNKT